MKVKGISFRYGKKELFSNISFNTNDHQLIIIEGRNGVGKSTLLKVLLGIKKQQEGSIVRNESIGYVPDSSEQYFVGMSPEILFRFIQEQFQIEKDFFYKQLTELKEKFLIREATLNQTILSLSLGEKKKVMLIAAFVIDAELYIMDEPFSGLDDNSLKMLYELIEDLISSGKKFIIATHGYNDEILDGGKVIYI